MVSGPPYVRGMRFTGTGTRIVLALAGLVATLVFVQLSEASASARRLYTVRPNDTLWTIANRFYASGITADTVYRIEQANHLKTALIVPGQTIFLP